MADKRDTVAALPSEAAQTACSYLGRVTSGYEQWTRTMTDAGARQVALSRTLLEQVLEDYRILAAARTPEALLQAEMAVWRRRSDRTLKAMQTGCDELRDVFASACQIPFGAGTGQIKPVSKPAA